VCRDARGVELRDTAGEVGRFDHVVIAAHADTALSMLEDPTDAEAALLGAFRYRDNHAVLHRDARLMPRRRRIWSSWNYIGGEAGEGPCVSYWMNRLQGIPGEDLFMALNPVRKPADGAVICSETYAHPLFDMEVMQAQRALWSYRDSIAPGTAERISARVSTRMDCKPDWRWRNSLVASSAPGTCRMSRGGSI
jgi:uncharacterized protein